MAQLSFVIFTEQEEFGAEIRRQLQETGHAQVAAVVDEGERLAEALEAHQPDALFADLGYAPHEVLDLIDGIPAPRPQLLVSGPQDDSQLILRAMKQGAREFFSQAPGAEEMREVIERLVLGSAPVKKPRGLAPVVSVMGAKGGVGATVVACQLAACLQESGGRTVVVDLNFPLGDVALHYDILPTFSLAHVAQDSEQLDATYLRSILQPHASGIRILAAPQQVEEGELIRGAHVDRVLGLLREDFDWVIADVSRSWNEASVRALDLSAQILLVTSLDVPTLNHARQHLDLLKRLGHAEAKIHTVANRYSKSDAITDRDFSEFLGSPPDARIPNDYATTVDSVNQGKPLGELAPRSVIHAAFASLARDLHVWCGLEPPQAEPPQESLLNRVRRAIGKGTHGTA